MTLHPQSGDLVLKYDINAIKRSIKNLLTTNLYERPFKPSLGINLSGMLFELSTMGTDGIVLEQDIIRMINTYEPRANVTDVFSSMNGTNLDVSLMLTISNDPRPQELNVTLQRIR
ncbi:GPW/gp25 family protein [bacterium]|nr:GPW/gp25 family protein [bacterium]